MQYPAEAQAGQLSLLSLQLPLVVVAGAAVVGAAVVGAAVVGAAVVGAAVVTAAPAHDSDSSPMASNANLVSVRTRALSSSAVPVGYKSRNWGA